MQNQKDRDQQQRSQCTLTTHLGRAALNLDRVNLLLQRDHLLLGLLLLGAQRLNALWLVGAQRGHLALERRHRGHMARLELANLE